MRLIILYSSILLFCLASCKKEETTKEPSSVSGCTDPTMYNYNPLATVDDGSCIPIVLGCTDSTSLNYNPNANTDDGSCSYPWSIGANYQGGIVFYLDATGEHGLIAAPYDQTYGVDWGCEVSLVNGVFGTAVGTGNQNTINITTGCNDSYIAGKVCADLTLGGYTDWFLPSKDELDKMHTNLHLQGLGNFSETFKYWSSSQIDFFNVWTQSFNGSGVQSESSKAYFYNHLRAIRAF